MPHPGASYERRRRLIKGRRSRFSIPGGPGSPSCFTTNASRMRRRKPAGCCSPGSLPQGASLRDKTWFAFCIRTPGGTGSPKKSLDTYAVNAPLLRTNRGESIGGSAENSKFTPRTNASSSPVLAWHRLSDAHCRSPSPLSGRFLILSSSQRLTQHPRLSRSAAACSPPPRSANLCTALAHCIRPCKGASA